ncbi:MAG: dipicolinate synthase subunit DpsA [Bacillota bacterium]
MGQILAGLKISVLGGDDRELILIPELIKLGASVVVIGYPPRAELTGTRIVQGVEEAVKGADVIILPMPGTDDHGTVRAVYAPQKIVLSEEIIKTISPKVPIFIGVAKPFLKDLAAAHGLRLIEIAELDDIAILNAIPSAEGAIQIAMKELPITIHGSQAFILGFGRVGLTLARMLQGIGAITTVVARRASHLARAYEMGCRTLAFTDLEDAINEAEIIFNTVPAKILGEKLLAKTSKEVLIVDLASQPGGTDFQAAERLGIKAILAPGLPGKVAPKTAGLILARAIPQLILHELSPTKVGGAGLCT